MPEVASTTKHDQTTKHAFLQLENENNYWVKRAEVLRAGGSAPARIPNGVSQQIAHRRVPSTYASPNSGNCSACCAAIARRAACIAESVPDDRRLEVVANALPIWGGLQIAVGTTFISPVRARGTTASPARRARGVPGVGLPARSRELH